MVDIKWVIWFICGLIAAVIYYKKYRTERDKDDNFWLLFLIFIWGCIGLLYTVYRCVWSKMNK